MLFVGESRPASGRFFYARDAGLYRAVRDAFAAAVDETVDDANFLLRFQQCGCYLTDLCLDPVDDLPARARREAYVPGAAPLTRLIAEHQPATVVVLLKSIELNVRLAAMQAQWMGELIVTPYPGRWKQHRAEFLERVVPVLRELCAPDFGSTRSAGEHVLPPEG